MYEPGFMAVRVPWLWRAFYNVNLGWLFEGMGLLPLENELQSRSLARWAWDAQRRNGCLPLDELFKPALVERLQLHGLSTRELFGIRWFNRAQSTYVRLSDLQVKYRKEAFDATRAGVERDLARIEEALRRGATFYVTPEGDYSTDGAMLPFRGIWDRLSPHVRSVYLVAISDDPFVGRRLSQIYRVVLLRSKDTVVEELQAARPVTTSALLSEWLVQHSKPFRAQEAVRAVEQRLQTLPPELFVDPELRRKPGAQVRAALRNLSGQGILREQAGDFTLTEHRRHPKFPNTQDAVAFQARFFAQTLEGLERSREPMHVDLATPALSYSS